MLILTPFYALFFFPKTIPQNYTSPTTKSYILKYHNPFTFSHIYVIRVRHMNHVKICYKVQQHFAEFVLSSGISGFFCRISVVLRKSWDLKDYFIIEMLYGRLPKFLKDLKYRNVENRCIFAWNTIK